MITTTNGQTNASKESVSEYILEKIKVGGWGGIVQISITLVACIILTATKIPIIAILWNIFILNLPATIDSFAMLQKVPKEIPSKCFRKCHKMLAVVLFATLIFAGVLAGMTMQGNISLDTVSDDALQYNMVLTVILKICLFFSVLGGIIKYSCDVLLEESRKRNGGSVK